MLTIRIIGLEETESNDLLETQFDFIHDAGRTGDHWKYEWQVGDTLLQDKRGSLKHSGRLDYPLGEPRIMYRGTICNNAIEAILVNVAK